MKKSPKDVVLAFIDALNQEDFDTAKSLLHQEMTFDGVMGKRDGSDAYIDDMQKMKYKYEILKAFEDGNDVSVLYNIDMSGKATIYTSGWYHVAYEKIKSLKVVFDPRPLLEEPKK